MCRWCNGKYIKIWRWIHSGMAYDFFKIYAMTASLLINRNNAIIIPLCRGKQEYMQNYGRISLLCISRKL